MIPMTGMLTTPVVHFENEGKTYTLDEQCSSIQANTLLESRMRREIADHHRKTLLSGIDGVTGAVPEEVFQRFVDRGLDATFGWPSLEIHEVKKFRRTFAGLAAVFSVGCVEMRKQEHSYDVAFQLVGSMVETKRMELFLAMRTAGGKELEKN